MEVHEGPGDARHAVEPEAGDGGQVPLERHDEVVLVRHVLVVGGEEELGEGLDLKGQQIMRVRAPRSKQ